MPGKLPYGPGSRLYVYWTVGEGAAKWMSSPTPFTTLVKLLREAGVPEHSVRGLANNLMHATAAGRALFNAHHGGKKHG